MTQRNKNNYQNQFQSIGLGNRLNMNAHRTNNQSQQRGTAPNNETNLEGEDQGVQKNDFRSQKL